MDLSIIIINYKSAHHVLNCLQSVYAQTREHSFEVIVVDNNSEDDSKEKVCAAFPNVVWVQTGYNAGFARANNAGIRVAKGTYILLLNADTIVLNGALDQTINLFKRYQAVACGVQLLNTDGSHQISGAHFVNGGLNLLLPLPYLGRLVRYLGYRLKTRVPSVQTVASTTEVDWIVGAFIMVEKKVLDTAGLLDEDFFMYAEEIEWCSRLRKQGKLVLFDAPQVVHLGGGTSSDYYNTQENENSKNLWSKKARQIIVSRFLQVRKQFGLFWFFTLCFFFLLEIPVFIVCFLIDKLLHGKRARFRWSQVVGYIANVICLLKYIPKMVHNKPFFYKVY